MVLIVHIPGPVQILTLCDVKVYGPVNEDIEAAQEDAAGAQQEEDQGHRSEIQSNCK